VYPFIAEFTQKLLFKFILLNSSAYMQYLSSLTWLYLIRKYNFKKTDSYCLHARNYLFHPTHNPLTLIVFKVLMPLNCIPHLYNLSIHSQSSSKPCHHFMVYRLHPRLGLYNFIRGFTMTASIALTTSFQSFFSLTLFRCLRLLAWIQSAFEF
jgi:hypothetical protein